MGGAKIEQKISFEGPEMSFSREIHDKAGKTYGFLIYSDVRIGIPKVYVEDSSIASVRVTDANDNRGYYCNITGLKEGETTLIAEMGGAKIEQKISFEGPEMSFSREIHDKAGKTYGFLIYSDVRIGIPKVYVEDSSIASVRVTDANDNRGYYCNITGLKEGETTLIAEMGGAKIEQKISFEGPEMSFSREIHDKAGKTYGFLIYSDVRIGIPKVYVEDSSIASVRVTDANDNRGYYCNITGLKEGETTLIAEMGGAKIEQKISFEGVGMSFSRTLNGEYGTTYGFLVLSDDRNGVLNLYTENENIANVRVVDPNDERGYYCEIDLLNEGVTTIIAEKDELTISMEVVVEKPAVIFSREVRGIVGETYGFLMYTDDRNEAPSICVEDSSIADVQIVDPNDQRGYYCEVTGLKDGSTYIIAEKNDKQYKMSVVFTDKGPSRGIDVSRYQLNINWSKVKNNGIEFAFIRAGGRYGASGSIYKDSYFEQNMRGAINAGIDVGVYFFTQAINESEAREEARYVCNLAKNYKVTYPIVIDTETLR